MAAASDTNDSNKMMTCHLKLDTTVKKWQKTISKVLNSIKGVSYTIDTVSGIVIVTGTIEPDALMIRLLKSGKHAELLRVDSGLHRDEQMKFKQQVANNLRAPPHLHHGYAPFTTPYNGYSSYYPPPFPPHHHQQVGYQNYPYFGAGAQDYYRGHHPQHYPNYNYHQPQPQGFPQPPKPLEIHPFYDPDTQCTIM